MDFSSYELEATAFDVASDGTKVDKKIYLERVKKWKHAGRLRLELERYEDAVELSELVNILEPYSVISADSGPVHPRGGASRRGIAAPEVLFLSPNQ